MEEQETRIVRWTVGEGACVLELCLEQGAAHAILVGEAEGRVRFPASALPDLIDALRRMRRVLAAASRVRPTHAGQRWSMEADQMLRAGWEAGMTAEELAEQLERSVNAIVLRLTHVGASEELPG